VDGVNGERACLPSLSSLQARFKGESVLVLSVLHISIEYRYSLPLRRRSSFPFFFLPFFSLKDLCQIVLPLVIYIYMPSLSLSPLASPRFARCLRTPSLVYIPYRIVPYYNT
jgi:hypothetical protein